MVQDLHAHTYYSFCGSDTPESVVETAIAGGIELLGITDHNYGIGNARLDVYKCDAIAPSAEYGRTLKRYYDHINLIKAKYADSIKILCGIEIATVNQRKLPLPPGSDISFFDFCLVEHLDCLSESITQGDLFAFAERCGCPTGVAHTDMFAFIQTIGADPLIYFAKMAEKNIFWEMNVNLDGIHHGREHAYMLNFFNDPKQQEIVRQSGVRLSVGFDGHRVYDYKPQRIADYCQQITDMGIPLAFADI